MEPQLKKLTQPRMGRGDFVFAVVGLALAWTAAIYFLGGGLRLLLELGVKTRPDTLAHQPLAITVTAAVLDALLVWFVVRRLRDAGYPGWACLALFVTPFFGVLGFVMLLAGLAALVLLPGQIGPNRFGPDPRGWRSREHFEEQHRRLRSGDI